MSLPTLIVASIVIDAEPLIVIVRGIPGYPAHGYLHTFLSSLVFGSALGFVFYLADRILKRPFEYLALVEDGSHGVKGYLAAGVFGWALHIFLDMPLYSEIKPFYPLTANPFYNPGLDSMIYHLCALLFFTGSFLYVTRLRRSLSGKVDDMVMGTCVGPVIMLLGLLSLSAVILNPVYVFPSMGLFLWGLFTFYSSIVSLDRLRRARIVLSGVLMLTAVSALYMLVFRSSYSRLTGEQLIGELLSYPTLSAVLFNASWFTSLISIIMLRPVMRSFGSEAGDGSFRMLVDLLIIGWALMLVLIGVFIVAPTLLVILMRMPTLLTRFSTREQEKRQGA
jgi:hypothetical protein